MKPLLTATALTMSLGFAAAPAMAETGSAVPEERRNYERHIEREVNLYEERMETMEIDPSVRASWVKVNQDWNTVSDEPVGSPKYDSLKADFEEAWTEFKSEFEAAEKKGWASNSAVPEERRTFEQSTSYDIVRHEILVVEAEAPESVAEKLNEVRSNWYRMHEAETYAEWDAARDDYVESWREYVDAANEANVM